MPLSACGCFQQMQRCGFWPTGEQAALQGGQGWALNCWLLRAQSSLPYRGQCRKLGLEEQEPARGQGEGIQAPQAT